MVMQLLRLGVALLPVTAFLWGAAYQGPSAWAQCGGGCGPNCADRNMDSAHPGHGPHTGFGGAGQPGHEGHPGHSDHAAQEGQPPDPAASAATADRAPHGGQFTPLPPHYLFEALYESRQIRLYLYDTSRQPLSLRGVRGQVVLRLRGQERSYRLPLAYVPPPDGTNQDYLAGRLDLAGLGDGVASATFVLQGLPNRQRPTAAFTQSLALSRTRPAVTIALLEESDQEGLARQKVCPVTGNPLGSHGTPVKLRVGGQPLYLCCRGCIAEVQKNPAAYVAPAPTGPGGPRSVVAEPGW